MRGTNIRLVLLTVLTICCIGLGVSTKEIDEVRKKTSFTDQDLAAVETFINEAFKEMVEAPTIAESVKKRENMLVRKPKADQQQYREQFIQSVEDNIQSALSIMDTWEDEKFIAGMRLNLAVIAGSLDAVRLADTAIEMMSIDDVAVRYWALKAVTGDNIGESINSEPSSELSSQILKTVKGEAEVNSAIRLAMLAEFAQKIETDDSAELLSTIAQTRIDAYKNNQAAHESSDAIILDALAGEISSDDNAKDILAPKFAALSSEALKKYAFLLSQEGRLEDFSSQQLITVIAELENNIFPALDVSSQLTRAVERKNPEEFQAAYDELFGTEDSEGTLTSKFGVDIDA